MPTAELPTQSSGIDLKGIASLADLFTGKNTTANTNTSGNTTGNTSGSNTGNNNTTGNTNGTASTQNAGGVRTTGTTTTSDNVTPEAVQAVVNSILQGSSGIAAIASGQARAGLYNSSTNQLLIDDMVARAAAEGAKLNKSTTVTQDTTAADNRTTTSTQNQNTQQNQNTAQSTQQATTSATNQAQDVKTVVAPQIKPTTAIGAIGGLTALGQLAQTEAGKALLKKLGLSSLIGQGAGAVAKAAPGGANDNGAASDTANGNPPVSSGPVNPNASVNAVGTPTATSPSPFPNSGTAPTTNISGNSAGPLTIPSSDNSASLISSLIGSNDGDLSTDQSGIPNGLADILPADIASGSGFDFGSGGSSSTPELGANINFLNPDGSSTPLSDDGASSDAGNGFSTDTSGNDSSGNDNGDFAGDAGSIGGLDGSLDVNGDGSGAFGDLATNAGDTAGAISDLFDFAQGGFVTPQGNHNLLKQKMVANASAKNDHDADDRSGARTHYATGGPVNVGLRVNAPPTIPRLSSTTNDSIVNAIQKSGPQSSGSQSQSAGPDLANAISAQVQPTAPSPVLASTSSPTSASSGLGINGLTQRSLIPTTLPSTPLLGNSGKTSTNTSKKHLDGTSETGTGVDAGESSVGSGIAEGETGPVSAAEGVGLAASIAGLVTGLPVAAVTNALGLSQSVPLSPLSALVAVVNAIANNDSSLNPDTVDADVDNAFDISNVVDATTPQDSIANDVGIANSDATDSGEADAPGNSDNGESSDAGNGNASSSAPSSPSGADDGNGTGNGDSASAAAGNDGSSASSDGSSDGGSSSGDGSAGDGGSSDGSSDGSSGGDGGSSDGGSSAGGDGGGAGGDFSTGGSIRGKGTSTSDSIKAHLSVGEYVMNANAVKAVGVDFLDKINNLFKPSPAKLAQGKRINAQQNKGR